MAGRQRRVCQIMLIDDSAEDRELFQIGLYEYGLAFDLSVAGGIADCLNRLRAGEQPDPVIADDHLADGGV